MKVAVLLAPAILLGFSAPAFAGKKEDRIALCMWERMPQSAAQFVDTGTTQEETKSLLEGLAICADGDMTINTKALKKRLAETRPVTIPENTEQPAIFICTRDADGKCEASE